jgi:predicted nucleotidyltransferase
MMISNASMMDVSRLTWLLSDYFAGRDDVALAFLFGSVARGMAGPDPTPISARLSIIAKSVIALKSLQSLTLDT